MKDPQYFVWIGGISEGPLPLRDAIALANDFKEQGYDDVQLVKESKADYQAQLGLTYE